MRQFEYDDLMRKINNLRDNVLIENEQHRVRPNEFLMCEDSVRHREELDALEYISVRNLMVFGNVEIYFVIE